MVLVQEFRDIENNWLSYGLSNGNIIILDDHNSYLSYALLVDELSKFLKYMHTVFEPDETKVCNSNQLYNTIQSLQSNATLMHAVWRSRVQNVQERAQSWYKINIDQCLVCLAV